MTPKERHDLEREIDDAEHQARVATAEAFRRVALAIADAADLQPIACARNVAAASGLLAASAVTRGAVRMGRLLLKRGA